MSPTEWGRTRTGAAWHQIVDGRARCGAQVTFRASGADPSGRRCRSCTADPRRKTRLEALTPEQQSRLAEWRDRWIGIGVATGPADRPAAEAGVRSAYARAGLAAPSVFVWLHSPLAGSYGAAMLAQVWDQVGDQVRAQVWDQVWDQVGAQVGDQVRAQVWDQVWDQVGDQVRAQVRAQVWDQVGAQVGDQVRAQVRAQVWDQVWDQVGDQVGDQVRAQVWDQVWDQVGAQVGDQVWDQVGRAIWGQHEGWWLSFYEYFTDVVGLSVDVKGIAAVAESAGWWWPFEGAVVLTERPTRLYRDDWGRLHNPDGPALEYPDGFAVYAVNGTRVPAQVILHPEAIHPDDCDKEQNLEIRRVMIDRMGPDKYMRSRGGKQVHVDDFGELWRIDRYYSETGEPLVMVKVINSTPNPDGSFRDFWLQVPPDMASARQAVAWTFDMPEADYELAAQS